MPKINLDKVKSAFLKKIDEKNLVISNLKSDLEAEKKKKRVENASLKLEFPSTVEVENFPKSFEVANLADIKFPEIKTEKVTFPKEFKIANLPKSFEVSNLDKLIGAIAELKQTKSEEIKKPTWVDATLGAFLEGLGHLLVKVTNRTFKISPTADSYLTPQYVMFINPQTGRPESVQTHVHGGATSGGSTAPANVGLKNAADARINPATNEKLDAVIAGLGEISIDSVGIRNVADALINPATNEKLDDVIAALNSISIDADSVNLNTDGLEALIAASNNGSPKTASSPTFATVGTSSAEAVAANASRKGLILTNTSSNVIYVSFGGTAVVGRGMVLYPTTTFSMDQFSFSHAAINAIASGAGSNLAIQEFI